MISEPDQQERDRPRAFHIQSSGFSAADIAASVAIHRQELGGGFLTSLGDPALTSIFALAAQGTEGILLLGRTESAQGDVCGFLLGSPDTGAFYKAYLRRKALSAALALLPRFLTLGGLRKAAETLLYPSRTDLHHLPPAELLDLAVARQCQGMGLAQALFRSFSAVLSLRGITEFRITTGASLVRAQRFYSAMGAKQVATLEVHRGEPTIAYVYSMVKHQAQPARGRRDDQRNQEK